jgi:hypothetical protein
MQQQVEKEANPTNSRLPYVCDNTNRTYLLHVIMTKPQPAFFSWWGTGGTSKAHVKWFFMQLTVNQSEILFPKNSDSHRCSND